MSAGWMIYGAYGYSGKLIAEEAARSGLKPIIAGRNREKTESLGQDLGLPVRVFPLDDAGAVTENLNEIDLVLNCAGPFSQTARVMMDACIQAKVHYLDITGEISVFEAAHERDAQAQQAGIILCPGVGFDVIPTDCVAATLKAALPDAVSLDLGFDSRSRLSPGTAKTSVEGLADGGKIRRDGKLVSVPAAYQTETIDFGAGAKFAMTIPWGDVSTAYRTTGIGNIRAFVPVSPRTAKRLQRFRIFLGLLKLPGVVSFLQKRIEKKVSGPSPESRAQTPVYVWGRVRNAAGAEKTARIKTANGYDITVTGSLAMVRAILDGCDQSGHLTPSVLMGADFITKLPGSDPRIQITES